MRLSLIRIEKGKSARTVSRRLTALRGGAAAKGAQQKMFHPPFVYLGRERIELGGEKVCEV